jgi:hypothetical protein
LCRREPAAKKPPAGLKSRILQEVGGGKFFQDYGLGNYARRCAALEVFPFVTVNPSSSYRETLFISFQIQAAEGEPSNTYTHQL